MTGSPHNRLAVLVGSVIASGLFIIVMTYAVGNIHAGVILLDSQTTWQYPFTIQNLMHLIFFIGFGEIFIRWQVVTRERTFIGRGFLPEDDETVLQAHDLSPIRRKVAGQHDTDQGFLPNLIDLCILQFMAGRSVDQTVSVLNSNLELMAHRVDLRYSVLRYIVWVIPTIGFIGTVIGIAMALNGIDPAEPDLEALTRSLGVSFYTTLVALCQSAILVLFMNLVQAEEEKSLNDAGRYTLHNLINRLYTGG